MYIKPIQFFGSEMNHSMVCSDLLSFVVAFSTYRVRPRFGQFPNLGSAERFGGFGRKGSAEPERSVVH